MTQEETGAAWIRFFLRSGSALWKLTGVPSMPDQIAVDLLWKVILGEHPDAEFFYGSFAWGRPDLPKSPVSKSIDFAHVKSVLST